jgi:PAS domain S-box-containing protein
MNAPLQTDDERKNAEALLQKERLFSETILASVPGVLYLFDQRGRYLRWSKSLETVSGYSAEEIARIHPLDFFADAEKPLIESKIAESFAKGESSTEAVFRTKNGKGIPFLFTGRRVEFNGEPCLVGMGIDISERKEAEAALHASDARFRLLMEKAPLAISISRLTNTVYVNQKYCEMYGFTRADEVIGRPVYERVTPEFRGIIAERAVMRARGETVPSDYECIGLRKDGSTFPVHISVARVELSDGPASLAILTDITERTQAEKALKESEQKLRAIFDQAPLGIALCDSTNGLFLKANSQYCKLTGYDEREILKRSFLEITHPGDVISDIEFMSLPTDQKQHTLQKEKRYVRKDGSAVWISLTAVPLEDGPLTSSQHIAMAEDITESKRAEDRLIESEQKYRELVELANSIILRWNSQGIVTFINEFGQRFFGFPAEEIIGRHVVGTIVPYTESGGRDLHLLMEQICADPGAFEQNVNENICRDGRRVTIAWTNKIVSDAQGNVAEILSIGTDITERQRAEEAIRELNASLEQRVANRTEELQAALVRAEAADRIKSAFLATMSHELRTPLNSIIGFTGIILQGLAGPLNAEQTKQLGMVRVSARHLLELINDVLDLSKIESGQIDVRAETFRLRDVLERVLVLVKPQADKKGLQLILEEAPGLGEILSDRRRVEQILLNLVNNAVKFTERGTVTLSASPLAEFRPPTSLASCPGVSLRVADTGIGIKPEDMSSLFQPFRQIDSGLTRQHEGTGLGLAICRRIATLLDGEITVRSQWAKGSEFSLILPVRKPT